MNLDLLIRWLAEYKITIAEKVPQAGGTVYIFGGTRPMPYDGRPMWFALPVKDGQERIARREIEALLRHFCHGELVVPRESKSATATVAVAVQPLQKPQSDLQN